MASVLHGSARTTTRPTEVDIPLDEILRLAPGAAVSFHAVTDFEAGCPFERLALTAVEAGDLLLFFGDSGHGLHMMPNVL